MFVPGILITFALDGVPLDPQPYDDDGFGALCHGPWAHADAGAAYRGVRVEDNGSGMCCALAIEAFVCAMFPGHQHAAVQTNHLRFYDGSNPRPRVDLVVGASPNPGLSSTTKPVPFVTLHLSKADGGFVLVPHWDTCKAPRAPAMEACANGGRWLLVDGIPKRP